MIIRWKCHICGVARLDKDIIVISSDQGVKHGIPEGIIIDHVRVCKDNPECQEKAKTFTFEKKERR